MKQIKYYLLVAVLMTAASCDYIANYDKPHLELTANPYQLDITKFNWGYGVTEINKFNGDFDRLDEKVYDLLKGKTGICRVNLQGNGKDKYGKADSTMQYIGDINIDELNKYQSWKYWQRDAGIGALLYKRFVKPSSMDSVKTEVVQPQANPQLRDTVQQVNIEPTTYKFGIDDLYPSSDKPSTDEQNRFVISGIIGEVYFDSGLFQIITTDGDKVMIHIYPSRASSQIGSQLQTAIKSGNSIKCVAEQTNPNNYELLAAKITI
jgi:hypothetical protein